VDQEVSGAACPIRKIGFNPENWDEDSKMPWSIHVYRHIEDSTGRARGISGNRLELTLGRKRGSNRK
jgi:hypothetical protein